MKSTVPRRPTCPGCIERDRKIAALENAYASLKKELEETKTALAKAIELIHELQERLGQNSRNSHIPPSKNPPQAPVNHSKKTTGRRPGGQPGHQGKKRDLLPIEKVDLVVPHIPPICEKCKEPLPKEKGPEDPEPLRHQVFELPEKLYEVTEHQAHGRQCPCCGHMTRASLPEEVASSCFGPKLTATASFLTGACHVSRRQTKEILEDVVGVPVALGTIANLEQEVSEALEPPHEEAAEAVRDAPVKNIDETGWKQKGGTRWLWVAATAFVAFFIIHKSRGREGFLRLLGRKLRGIFTTDRWPTYKARAVRFRQVCWAHLIRDFQKLIDRGDAGAKIGKKAQEIATLVFLVWKDFKAGSIDRETLQLCLRGERKELKRLLEKGARLKESKASNFCKNLLALEPALWTFVRVEGVEPTNNHAERVLRRGVLWRKNAFGSRSESGSRFVERILTVVQSLRLQKRPVLNYIVEAVKANRNDSVVPSILPS